MREIKPPSILREDDDLIVFLAGSIEQNFAIDWQQQVVDEFRDDDVTFYNPRRDDWDETWVQEMGANEFTKQVGWELSGLEKADLIVMYFDKDTKSPITLLELGMYLNSGKLVVCCPDGFYRKGNVDITCTKYGVPLMDSLYGLIDTIREKL